ncbi:MAG: hypothetical protein R3D29_05810 [Nitratireductor sp.]
MDISLTKKEIELAQLGRDFFEKVLAPLELMTDEHGELPEERRKPREEVVKWGLPASTTLKKMAEWGLRCSSQLLSRSSCERQTALT